MKTSHKVGVSSAAVVTAVIAFTAGWEGTDLVAKKDMIGTGHPLTYCHGQTDEFGKVKVGQRFTPAQCDKLLAESLPKYLKPIQACITVDLPTKVMGAALDASYNAGPVAVCKSPMVERFNAHDLEGGCEAFLTSRVGADHKRIYTGWYIRASGRVVQGLINRRKAEREFCLAGLKEASAAERRWWQKMLRFFEVNSK